MWLIAGSSTRRQLKKIDTGKRHNALLDARRIGGANLHKTGVSERMAAG
jgi:hypothetical protein